MFNKKGVSPLIATVLLVMIVVSIGAAVMVVIQGLSDEQIKSIETQADLLECGVDVEATVMVVNNKYRICTNITTTAVGNFSIVLENTGQKDLSGFKIIVYGDDGVNSTTYGSEALSKGDTKTYSFTFTGVGDNSGELGKIIVSPQIVLAETITCKEPNLEFDMDLLDILDDCGSVTWDNGATVPTAT